jgi:hypothetical protein
MGFIEERSKKVNALAEEKRRGMFLPPRDTGTGGNGDILERLAAIEHEKWRVWAGNLMERETLSEETRARWTRFMVPYGELPDEIKQYSRDNAKRTLEFFGNFFNNF